MSLDEVGLGGRFRVLAIDHRDSLRAFMRPDDPGALGAEEITRLKADIAGQLADLATGVMLEPEYSIPQVSARLPPGVGFIAALEAQGYLADPGAAPTEILEGWSPAAARACGAAAAKLLLPYHPDRPLAGAQEAVGRRVVRECRSAGIPLVLEPLFYDLDDPGDRPRVVLETARRFADAGADLLKLPFPIDPQAGAATAGHDVCARITDALAVPWALLSGGGSFAVFADQLRVAVAGGCSGFMVGRALWGEAARAAPDRRARLLRETVRPRLELLAEIS